MTAPPIRTSLRYSMRKEQLEAVYCLPHGLTCTTYEHFNALTLDDLRWEIKRRGVDMAFERDKHMGDVAWEQQFMVKLDTTTRQDATILTIRAPCPLYLTGN